MTYGDEWRTRNDEDDQESHVAERGEVGPIEPRDDPVEVQAQRPPVLGRLLARGEHRTQGVGQVAAKAAEAEEAGRSVTNRIDARCPVCDRLLFRFAPRVFGPDAETTQTATESGDVAVEVRCARCGSTVTFSVPQGLVLAQTAGAKRLDKRFGVAS